MRKPVGVIVAAVVLGLMTLAGLLGVVLAFIGTFFIHNPFMPTGALGHEIRAFQAVFYFIFVCVLAFCAWTVAGLFRMRAWARYSIVVLGILTALFFGATSALFFYLSKFIRGPMAASSTPAGLHPGAVLVVISLPVAAIALIGIWWVVYFNLKHVRRAFAGARMQIEGALVEGAAAPVRSEYGPWRIVVIVLAILMLIGGFELLVMGALHLPLYLFGFIVAGKAALFLVLLMAAIEFFIGIGLLCRNQSAYWTAIVWQVFGILMMAFMLTPSARNSMITFQAQLSHRFSMEAAPMPSFPALEPFLVTVSILSWVVFLIFIYALLRCRRWYVPAPVH